jgi:PIN domain nuclease of toxin-antitoxin system
MLNLDTHILLHAVTGKLTPRESKLLAAKPWGISAIVLWEIAKLAQLKRITVNLQDQAVVRVLSAVHVWPITTSRWSRGIAILEAQNS